MTCVISYFICWVYFFACVIGEEEVVHHVSCETTKGPIKLEVYPSWAPLGAARFIELVKDGFYTDIALFRCVEGFLTQFGISDKPDKKHWHRKEIKDDPNLHKGIKKHYISFAGGGPNTRSTQIFFAFEDLDFLGNEPWEVPFGKVVEGESVLKAFYKGNGDIPPFGHGPDQGKLHNQGNDYIRKNFPKTDFILSCSYMDEIPNNKNDQIENDNNLNPKTNNDIIIKELIRENIEKSLNLRTNLIIIPTMLPIQVPPLTEAKSLSTEYSIKSILADAISSSDISHHKNDKTKDSTVNIAMTAIVLLGLALCVLYILSQYQSEIEVGKTV